MLEWTRKARITIIFSDLLRTAHVRVTGHRIDTAVAPFIYFTVTLSSSWNSLDSWLYALGIILGMFCGLSYTGGQAR